MGPHHPLFCVDVNGLKYHEDGSLTCAHSKVLPGVGLQSALDYTVALLIVELASEDGWKPFSPKKKKPSSK